MYICKIIVCVGTTQFFVDKNKPVQALYCFLFCYRADIKNKLNLFMTICSLSFPVPV